MRSEAPKTDHLPFAASLTDRFSASSAGSDLESRPRRWERGNRRSDAAARARRNASPSIPAASSPKVGVSTPASADGPRRYGATRSSRFSTSWRIRISVARRRRDALGTTWQERTGPRGRSGACGAESDRTIACGAAELRLYGTKPVCKSPTGLSVGHGRHLAWYARRSCGDARTRCSVSPTAREVTNFGRECCGYPTRPVWRPMSYRGDSMETGNGRTTLARKLL